MESHQPRKITHLSANGIRKRAADQNEGTKDEVLVLQIIAVKVLDDGANQKGLKARLVLSDGVSQITCLLFEKVLNKFNPDDWRKVQQGKNMIISAVGGSLQSQSVKSNAQTIIILKEPFQIVYTGLKRTIGSPQGYDKNATENNFPTNFDLVIPLDETDQFSQAKSTPSLNMGSAGIQNSQNSVTNMVSGMQIKSPTAASTNLNQRRVLPPSVNGQAYGNASEKKRPSLSNDDAGFMPVSCLNTFTQDWVIKVKVCKKYDLKHWNNVRGTGTLLNVDLMDKSSGQIQATFFNDAATKWHEGLEEGKVYSMRGGQVKLANKRYTTIPNDHCLSFDQFAQIEEIVTGGRNEIQGGCYNFTTLKKVQEATQVYMIDLIAVVQEAQEVRQIQMKTGELRDRKQVTFVDDTGVSIMATLWGSDMAGLDLQVGQVVAIKGARVSEYGGKSLNMGSDHAQLRLDPDEEPRCHELQRWYKKQTQGGEGVQAQKLTQLGESSVDLNSLPMVLCEEMHQVIMADEQFLQGESTTPLYFKVSGEIQRILADKSFSYAACPECKKKVLPADGGQGWWCERCQKTYDSCNHTYNFSCTIGDFTSAIYAQVLGEQVGDAIMGMPAKDLLAIHELSSPSQAADGFGGGVDGQPGPNSEFRQTLDAKNNQPGIFLIRAKVDTYTMGSETEENRVRYYLSKFTPKNVLVENTMLTDKLQMYSKRM